MITKEQINDILKKPISDEHFFDLKACLTIFDIKTPLRIAHFLAQIIHESGGFRWFLELASGKAYEGRADLGNTEPGDGEKYKGAGPIMITGRFWYTLFSEYMNDPHIMLGAEYVAENYPFTSAGFWWMKNDMNKYVDEGATCRQVSKRVNGKDPANGLRNRIKYFERTKKVLKIEEKS